jgi:methionine-rich copper-binding protein CopC
MTRTLAAALLLLVPGLARAHAMLEGAVPPVGGTVPSAPPELRLSFSEGIEPRFTTVSLAASAGAPPEVGTLRTDPADAHLLLVPVGKLAPGTYTVTWHAVSVDTHRTQGTYRFTVAP